MGRLGSMDASEGAFTEPASVAVKGKRATGGGLPRREFFAAVVERLPALLPEALSPFQHRAASNLLKLHYGNDRIHFEVWTDGIRGQIEIGLHFEDGPVSTAAYLTFFDDRIVELKHELGTQLELERWTPSWGHLCELLPLGRLDQAAAARVARRLAALIEALHPLVVAASIPPERSAQPAAGRGPWRSWRRGRG